MTFNSDEINFLIFRYLQEAGYNHASYVFGLESMISKTNIDGSLIPPGSLITLLQRALHYTDADISIAVDGQERYIEAFSLLDAVIPEMIEKRKKSVQQQMLTNVVIPPSAATADSSVVATSFMAAGGGGTVSSSNVSLHNSTNKVTTMLSGEKQSPTNNNNNNVISLSSGISNVQSSKNLAKASSGVPTSTTVSSMALQNMTPNSSSNGSYQDQQTQPHRTAPTSAHHLSMEGGGTANRSSMLMQQHNLTTSQRTLYNSSFGGALTQATQPSSNVYPNGNKMNAAAAAATSDNRMEVEGSMMMMQQQVVDNPSIRLPRERVITLTGHTSEVFICAWNPIRDILASGSGDSTARIWNLETGSETTANLVLTHYVNKDGRVAISNKDVTSLDWNSEGSRLATGSYDGYARVWDTHGNAIITLGQHKGPIFALKWSKRGNHILTAGVDRSAIIWEVSSGRITQQFPFHSAPTLDVDWQSSHVFASCSTDSFIHCCRLGYNEPIKTFKGHANEVNAIKWDPTGTLLASCSDDMTLKVWSMDKDECVHDFHGHTKEIYTIKWSPRKQENGDYVPRYIASASFDNTVRIWDLKNNSCAQIMEKHTEPVYSVAFSPDGNYLATGSFDYWVIIWKIETRELVHTHKCTGGIFEVCWNASGTKVAASAADGSVVVLDLSSM